MTIYTYMNEMVLIVRDSDICDEAFLAPVPKTVIDSINYDYFDDYRFCGVQRVYGWADLDMCAAYKTRYGWTLYCTEDGKLDKILRPKVLPIQTKA